jgi:hypothetical protein
VKNILVSKEGRESEQESRRTISPTGGEGWEITTTTKEEETKKPK